MEKKSLTMSEFADILSDNLNKLATAEGFSFCGTCGKPIDGEPALSRKDNDTELCSSCATAEALAEL